MPDILQDCKPVSDPPVTDGGCTLSPHETLFWVYMLKREHGARQRKHLLRMAVQHGVLTDENAAALAWAFHLRAA